MAELPPNSRGLALGGLAGNNAHGAGVLQAALECDWQPQMISCSSGQIHWVHRYLAYRKEDQRENLLRNELTAAIDEVSPTKMESIDAAILSVTGRPNIFRPALAEFPLNVLSNLAGAFSNIMTNATKNWQALFAAHRELARVLPSQVVIPLFPDSFFQDISDAFNQTNDVGLLFNSFDVQSGEEYVYCNKRARDLLDLKFGEGNRYRRGTKYRRITPEAVREGLWIYEYGEPRNVSAIDGAYYRQIILSELSPVYTIYVARPINSRWIGSFPKSWVGLQDLKTEVNFNGSYAGERDKIELMNRLVREKTIPKKKGYHQIKVEELEIEMQRGYFDYARESVAVFDQAYEAARSVFADEQQRENAKPAAAKKGKRKKRSNAR